MILRKISLKNIIRNISKSSSAMNSFKYPNADREDVKDVLFNKEIKDPYRYLENPNDPKTVKFIDDQNLLTLPLLKEGDIWNQFNEKLKKLYNYPKFTCASKRGKNYFYSHNSGLQNQNVVYYQTTLLPSEERKVFLDPNQLSSDGTVSLQFLVFSQDGSKAAFGLSESGSDWVQIKFRNVETKEDYPETLLHSKFFRPTFTHDNKGVFYGRFMPTEGKADGSETEANENQKVYYHRIGEDQSKDVLVAEFPENKNWRFSAEVSDCGSYLIFYIMTGCSDQLLYFADLRKTPNIDGILSFQKIVTEFEADYDYITNEGSLFYFLTNKSAPNFRLIAIDFENYAESNWKTIIAETTNVLNWASCVNKDKLVCHFMEDVKSVLSVHSLHTGELQFRFKLEPGSIQGFFGDKHCNEIFYHFVSFLDPGTVYHYDFKTPNLEPTVFKEITIENFDRNLYMVEQVFFPSTDNVKIPMFVVRKKEEEVKPKPLLLYGYGGFNIAIQPSFSITLLAFVDIFDGVLCFANIRGGGEYGKNWHDSGRLLNKQNVFNDFQEAARFLIANKYTTKSKLAIQGGSNGGLLVGSCIVQQPSLFQASIAQVGVFDMLRYHKFTIGSAWTSDFGSPDEEIHFNNLLKYSPLHNTKEPTSDTEAYPATLILTGDHDDRVSPLHSLKFAATLQHAVKDSSYQKLPILLRVYTKAGHGQGKPILKKIEESTDILVFLHKYLELNEMKKNV